MRIRHVEVFGLHHDSEAGVYRASLSLEVAADGGARGDRLHFLCSADLPATAPRDIVVQALLDDALRQARRMPGFRRGEEPIEIDPNFRRSA
ncbi:MAG: hypothetical protein D6801_03885 [Alphaproteobacteria bacterium]|nr:MAG: hypothetical protein D6801_03885 [Alphaproteobacteria bacterium]